MIRRTLLLVLAAAPFLAQTAVPQGPQAPGAPITLDLAEALRRAREYSQQFLQAGISAALAHEDRVQAKAALFPTISTLNQFIYTQGNGTPSGVFVANDGIHVYSEQAALHTDVFSFTRFADFQRTVAADSAARARQDIALRGLAAIVVQSYYAVVSAQRHEVNARRSVEEAARFLDLTRKQEQGGEVARADVIKAQLQHQQRQRDQLEAETTTRKARITLGVIVFPNLEQPYDVVDDLKADMPLPAEDEVRSLALSSNPELRAAQAGVNQAQAGISLARAAYYPTLALDYFFGINANVFDINGPDGRKNLGSVVQATVNVPVWNWGATRSRVRQAELQRKQAQQDLTFAQRGLQLNLDTFYLEAQVARTQIESLRSSLALSEESLRLTVLRYQAGEATALEVVDAQSTLVQARNAYDDGLARYRAALAGLQVLTGRF